MDIEWGRRRAGCGHGLDHGSISHNAIRVFFQHGGVMYKNVFNERPQMLRIYLPHLKCFLQGSRLLRQVHHCNSFVARICSLTNEHNLSSTATSSSLRGGYKLKNAVTSLIPFIQARTLHASRQLNGHLLEMLEDLQKKKRVKSKQDQLASSFNIVRQIQMETDPDELLEIHNALKNETNDDHENLAVLSAQVALFSRFAFLAARQDGYRLTSDDRVVAATVHLANIIRWKSKLCEPTHLATTVHGIATLGLNDISYFIHFEREIKSCDPTSFTNADLAMILWAYGKAQFRAKHLYKIIRNEIMARDLSTFKVKEICQFLWSYARTLEKGAKLFAVLREEILRRDLTEFEERSLTIILWSFSEVGLNVKPLFRCIKQEILQRGLACFTNQQLAQIASSYAQQNIRSPDLFQEICAEIVERGDLDFAPVGVVMIANSFAKTKNYIRDLFKLIESHLMTQDLSVYEPLQLVRFLWAFTNASLMTEPLFDKLTKEILLTDFSSLNDLALEELVKSLEGSRLRAPELVAATEAELVRRSETPI